MSFSDLGAFEREITANIRYGRVFLSEVIDAPVLSEGVLVIIHPLHGAELRLPAQIVMVNSEGPMRGTGIALRAFGANDVSQVESFARNLEPPYVAANSQELDESVEPGGDNAPEPVDFAPAAVGGDAERDERACEALEAGGGSDTDTPGPTEPDETTQATVVPGAPSPTLVPGAEDQAVDEPSEDEAPAEEHGEVMPGAGDPAAANERLDAAFAEPDPEADPPAEPQPDASEHDWATDDASAGFDEEAALGFDEDPSYDPEANIPGTQASTRQERLRALNAVEQLKVARKGELADRIVVERLYGKQVWEALLQNPRITLPEVARIARKGSVPRPLLEIIWENGTWTRDASVRRALLGNPKLTADAIVKLLKQTPKHELKLLEKTTAYSMAVRDIARKLLRE
jgi:hypothetical protein